LRRQTKERGGDLLGDDAAVLTAAAPVVTVDQQIAGTHFPADLSPATVARRLLAVCLSDLAAMGAEPRYSFLALTMPKGFDPRSFFTALLAACEARGVVLAGGDLARGPALAAALTLCGRRFRRGRILQRSDARPGDAIWLGAEFPARRATRRAAGRAVRRHLEPRAQIELGRWLAGRRRAAAIDISDGLAMDLHRLCRASGVGAEIDVERLPLPAELDRLAIWLEQSPLELALAGGEDYVLLFTLGPTLRPPADFAARRIGRIVAGRRLTLTEKGDGRPLPATGWDHLRRPGGSSGSPDSK
jgi:thiamine-monophosphate kinase